MDTDVRPLIEHVAAQLAAAVEVVSFGEAVRHVEQCNEGPGFELDGAAGLRLSFGDFLAAVALAISWDREQGTRVPSVQHLSAPVLAAALRVPSGSSGSP